MTIVATTGNEVPVFIPSGEDELFGILTSPVVEANGITVVLLTGGGRMSSTHRNRMFVHAARRASSLGYHVLRFDYRGVGESSGDVPLAELDRPAIVDLMSALEWLKTQGLERVVVVGTCYGGRMALHAAPSIPNLEGLVLSSTPVEDYIGASSSLLWHARKGMSKGGLLLRSRWPKYARIALKRLRRILLRPIRRVATPDDDGMTSPLFMKPLRDAISRDIPVLLLHGDTDIQYAAFERALTGRLGRVIADSRGLVTVAIMPGELHGSITLGSQEFLLQHIEAFLRDLRHGSPQRPGGVDDNGL